MHQSRNIFQALILVLLALLARAALAAEVVLQVPADAQDLKTPLRAASLSAQTAGQDNASAQDILAAARADYARLAEALYRQGRYGAVISIHVDGREAADIPPLDAPDRIARVVLRVMPGPRFTFSRAAMAPLAPGTALPPGYRPGQPAPAGVIENAARDGVDGWRAAGHAKATIADQRIMADHRGARLSSRIALAPGPQLRFGRLRMLTESRVRPGRVRAIAGLPEGRIYSPQELQRAARRLRRAGAFSSVTLAEAETPGPGDRLDIEATLVDAKPRRIGAGAELASREGLTLSGFWLHRNLLGGAERLRIEGRIGGFGGSSGGSDLSFSTRFERPATLRPDTDLFLEARVQDLDQPDYRERSLRLSGGLSREFSDKLRGEAGLAYQYSDINDDLGARRLAHLLFPLSATQDTRDDPLDATHGAYLNLDATPFVGLDTDALGARLYLDTRTYWAFGAKGGLVFATRAQLGTVAGANVADLPADMLFYSGGAGTVRGQSFQSLGVSLGGGRQIGGRSFAAISGELRARVADKWAVVGFADGGLVAAESWWADDGETHFGGGIGLRYDTGLGPVRVDVATPLGSDAGENVELYVGIGQAF